MAIRVRCPRCWETAEVPEEALGKQGICNSCGALVTIPARLTKVCFICGEDVTHTKHAKDRHGNYVCRKCLDAAQARKKSEFQELEDSIPSPPPAPETVPSAPIVSPPPPQVEKPAEVAAEPHVDLAAPPHEEEHAPAAPAELAVAVAQSNGSRTIEVRRRGGAGAAVLSLVAIGACAVLGYWHMEDRALLRTLSGQLAENEKIIQQLQERLGAAEVARAQQKAAPDWEDEHRMQILLAKSQAELLVSMGKVGEGIEQYERLLKLVKDQRVGPAMMQEIREAQAQLAEARVMERNAAVAAKTTSVPEAQGPVAPVTPRTEPVVAQVAKGEPARNPTTRAADPGAQAIIPAPLPAVRTPETTAPVAPPVKSIFDD